jgi:hypothetical protein
LRSAWRAFLNAVFAFAIARAGTAKIRPAVQQARRHRTPILVSGAAVGLLLALSTTVVARCTDRPNTRATGHPGR